MKKKHLVITIFIIIAILFIALYYNSDMTYLNRIWENTMNAKSGRIVYTGVISKQGIELFNVNNTKTVIDFNYEDNNFFYERNVYYEDNMKLKQTDKISEDGKFIIAFPDGIEEMSIKEPIKKKINLDYICNEDWTKLESRFIENFEYDPNIRVYKIKFKGEFDKNNLDNKKEYVIKKEMEVKINESSNSVEIIKYKYIIKSENMDDLEIQKKIEYNLKF